MCFTSLYAAVIAEQVSAWFAAAFAIKEKGKVVFGGDPTISKQPYIVGMLLSRKKPDAKALIDTLVSVWGLNRLKMRTQGDRYLLHKEEDRSDMLCSGPYLF